MRFTILCLAALAATALVSTRAETAEAPSAAPQASGEGRERSCGSCLTSKSGSPSSPALPLSADLSAALGRGPPGARQAGRGGQADGRDLPAPGLDRQPGDARGAEDLAGAARRGGPPVLRHQLRPLGPPGRAPAVPRRQAPSAGRGLLPGGHHEGGLRGLDRQAPGGQGGIHLDRHGDPPRHGRRASWPCPTPRSTPSG